MNGSLMVRFLLVAFSFFLFAGCEKESKQTPPQAEPTVSAPSSETARPTAPDPLPESPSFSASLPTSLAGMDIADGGDCGMDRVNLVKVKELDKSKLIEIDKEKPLVVAGWALDQQTTSVPSIVMVELASDSGPGRFFAVGKRGRLRPELAVAFKNAVYETAGYILTSRVDEIPAGKYNVNIIQNRGTSLIRCSTQFRSKRPTDIDVR